MSVNKVSPFAGLPVCPYVLNEHGELKGCPVARKRVFHHEAHEEKFEKTYVFEQFVVD